MEDRTKRIAEEMCPSSHDPVDIWINPPPPQTLEMHKLVNADVIPACVIGIFLLEKFNCNSTEQYFVSLLKLYLLPKSQLLVL